MNKRYPFTTSQCCQDWVKGHHAGMMYCMEQDSTSLKLHNEGTNDFKKGFIAAQKKYNRVP